MKNAIDDLLSMPQLDEILERSAGALEVAKGIREQRPETPATITLDWTTFMAVAMLASVGGELVQARRMASRN